MSINWTNVTTAKQILELPQTQSGGVFYGGMLILLFAVTFSSLIPFGFSTAFLVSCFLASIVSLLLFFIGVTSQIWFGVFIGGFLVGIIFLTITSKKND